MITIQSTKDKTLWVVTTFLSKKIEAEQFRNAANRPLRYTSKNVAVSTSKDSIRKKDENVKKSLDVDTDGNKLSAEQQEYFVDSKIRDEDGRLLVVYHGTDYDFNGISNSSMSSFSRTV